jgi:hypothetical protein
MKNVFLALAFVVFFTDMLLGQVAGGTYEKLAKLYNQGKYESCLFKADKYTYDEESSIDAEPYLYVAMCFYQLSISEDPVLREDYKDGFKQAIKYATKFIKKDKEGELYEQNFDFINILKDELKKEIKAQFDKGDYRKVATTAKLFDKLNRKEDILLLYYIGMNEMMSNNVSQGSRDLDDAKSKLDEMLNAKTFQTDAASKSLAIDGFLKYSEFLINQNQLKEAADLLNYGLKLFPNDGYLKVQFNVVNQKANSK